jgi:hypothetical protein
MSLAVITDPATPLLTTVDRIKDELSITDTSSDDVLYQILRRASDAITRECGRPAFGVAQYQETLKGSGSQTLGLTCVPVLAVSQVLQDQEVISPWSPGTNEGYLIDDAEAGALFRPEGWGQTVATLSWGWEAYGSRYILPGGTNTLRYTVTYWAGYLLPPQDDYVPYDPAAQNRLDTANPPTTAAVPALLNVPSAMADPPRLPGAIEQACLETVKAWWFSRQRDVTVSQQRIGEVSVTYDAALQDRALPTVALGLLRNYRRVA